MSSAESAAATEVGQTGECRVSDHVSATEEIQCSPPHQVPCAPRAEPEFITPVIRFPRSENALDDPIGGHWPGPEPGGPVAAPSELLLSSLAEFSSAGSSTGVGHMDSFFASSTLSGASQESQAVSAVSSAAEGRPLDTAKKSSTVTFNKSTTKESLSHRSSTGTKQTNQSAARSNSRPSVIDGVGKNRRLKQGKSSEFGDQDPKYVDELLPEDVGFSFWIRAAADFSSDEKSESNWQDGDEKHLYGLANIFAERTDEALEQKKGKGNFGLQRQLSRISHSNSWMMKTKQLKMPFAATSAFASRFFLFLQISAVTSCMFVVGFCAVEPACEYGSIAQITWAHLANSIIYGLVAIPSRGLFSRVDWRIGEELNRPSEVFAAVLKSPGLYLDVLSFVGLLAELAHHLGGSGDGPLPTPNQWMMLVQLVKGWRVVLPEDSKVHRGFWQGLFRLLLYLVAFAHAVGCTFLLLGNYERSQGSASWLDKPPYAELDMRDCVVRYTEAFYFAVIGLTSVGYGDLLVTSIEHNLNAFFLLISQLFAAKVCAELTWLTSMYNQHESDVHERRRSLVLALEKMGVPKVLVKRVLAFQSYENTMHADNMDKETFHGLGKNLMEELRLCTYRKLVLQAPFLREQPTEVISFIVNALWDAVYLPSDLIVRAGEHGRELFFVRRGEARAYLGPHSPVWGQSTAVAIMKAGSYFGELAMLTGLPRGSFVMATSYCICSVLPYSAVEDLVEMHPEAFTTLVQTMVRMYSLKPEWTWKDLTFRLIKQFGLETDEDAFMWFRSHTDATETDDLYAKAFDMALQRLKVPHLDRIIFWSELDTDASGGISFEEFQGKMFFEDRTDFAKYGNVPSVQSQDPRDRPSVLSQNPSTNDVARQSTGSFMDWSAANSSFSNPVGLTTSKSWGGDPSEMRALLSTGSMSSSAEVVEMGRKEDSQAVAAEKPFALLLEQNQCLLQEINRNLHLIKPGHSS